VCPVPDFGGGAAPRAHPLFAFLLNWLTGEFPYLD
jgi:hypothetical protein